MRDSQHHRRPLGCVVILAAVLLLTLYVLSAGPTSLLVEPDSQGAEIYRTVYAPVIWLAGNAPWPIGNMLTLYLFWWDDSDEWGDYPEVRANEDARLVAHHGPTSG